MTDKPDSLRSIYVEQPVHPAIAELHNKEPDTNAPKVYDEYGIVAGGITKQLISDAAKRSPLFGAGQIMSTPSDAPNPYYRHWNDSLECHAQTEMSQHGATSVAELPDILRNRLHAVLCPTCGHACQPLPAAGQPVYEFVFRCTYCYERHHAQKNVLPGSSADHNELGPGGSADLPEAKPTARSQSPAWNVAPWVEPLSYAGAYSPTD